MADLASLTTAVMRRDKSRCQACGIGWRPVLATHHIIPVELGGKDTLSNLVALCANCHRSVHWLATGDRSRYAHAYGLGANTTTRRGLLKLARRIRSRRLKVVGVDRVLSTAVPLAVALDAIVARNGFGQAEARLLQKCFRRAWNAISTSDRHACSVRLVRQARFVSVNANNHLALRVPAWTDDGFRDNADIALIWPQAKRPSIWSPAKFRRESSRRFKLIPYFNISLTWDECLALTMTDWRVFRNAVHAGLTLARTARRISNILTADDGRSRLPGERRSSTNKDEYTDRRI
jgi:hypothetical protein